MSRTDEWNVAGAYGQNLGSRFRLDSAPVVVTRTLRRAEMAVTEIRGDVPDHQKTNSIPPEDAFLIGLQLRDFPGHEYWEDGRPAARTDLKAGDAVLYDLRRDPVALLNKPFHSLHFYLPRMALDTIADESGTRRIANLRYTPGTGVDDGVLRNLGRAMHAALDHPDHASRLFLDHITLAVAAHVAHAYGDAPPRTAKRASGGLAAWQERRAKEVLGSNLDGSLALKDVAQECGLSASHFARAFRVSTGKAPHAWLLEQRVVVAKTLMADRQLPLAEVAIAAGFADQSHFTRVFTRQVGTSPGAWRRANAR
jgi:AraC-like DNA-binding protein